MTTTVKTWQSIFQYAIGAMIVLGFIGLVFVLVFHLAPESNSALLNVLVGAFGAMTIQVVNYMFSSSKSSADKTEMLANSSPVKE